MKAAHSKARNAATRSLLPGYGVDIWFSEFEMEQFWADARGGFESKCLGGRGSTV